jgi:hypothetical protein
MSMSEKERALSWALWVADELENDRALEAHQAYVRENRAGREPWVG